MQCPKCNSETSSILRFCENCNADLESYNTERDKLLDGTGDTSLGSGLETESLIINIGPAGGVLIMVASAIWFFGGLYVGIIFFYPPVLFVIGLIGFIISLKVGKKRKALKRAKKEGKLID